MSEQSTPHVQVSQEQTDKLEQLAEVSPALLFEATTAFPFRIFPCKVILTRSKISTIDHFFFFAKEVRSMLIKDIARVDVDEAGFLATVNIFDRAPNGVVFTITHLWKSDAQQLRRFIEGLMIADRQGVDINQIEDENIVENLEALGRTSETPSTVAPNKS